MSSLAISQSYISESATPSSSLNGGRIQFTLVIPTLCEAGNILGLLDEVRSTLDHVTVNYEIIVVDDESCDGTSELVQQVVESDSRVRLLIRSGERGLSGAILHGWRHSKADVLGVMDADLQHPPTLLPQLLKAVLDGRDIAIGSRYTKGGETGRWNWLRKLWSSCAVSVTLPLQFRGIRAKDPMSGYFVVRRACLDDIHFQSTGFKLLLEILVRGRIGSLQEIPFAFGRRSTGASKANIRVAMDFLCLLVRLYANRLLPSRRRRDAIPVQTLPEIEQVSAGEPVILRRW